MMKYSARRRDHYNFQAILLLLVLWLVGCSTPPSVAPLLRVTERALLQESQRIRDDIRRDTEQTRGTLQALEDGFNQDLEQVQALTPQWVREATAVYVAARETIVRYQNRVAQDRHRRADNLQAAASATRRAINMLEQQDRLLDGVIDVDLRRLIGKTEMSLKESYP